MEAVRGESIPVADFLEVLEGSMGSIARSARWVLRGTASNERYATRREHDELVARQAPLGRPHATRAALIPVRKSAAWWELSQDERRAIFEDRSRHIAIGLEYLPAVARRLHHCRELPGEQFDFLTWFEYAPEHSDAFEVLVRRLRSTEEWTYVEREIDIRLAHHGGSCVDKEIVTLDLHGPGTDWPLGRSADHGAGGHVELATVARAGHDGPAQTTVGERAPHMSTGVVEGVEMTVRIGDVHIRSRDIEDAHVSLFDVLRATNSCRHVGHLH